MAGIALSSLGICNKPFRRSPIASQASSSVSQGSQVSLRSPRPQNVSGEVYVDHTCIDCDTCRWMAPSVFSRVDEKSAVYHQPTSSEERILALQALLSCPTSSIRTIKPPSDIKQVHDMFPLPIDEEIAKGVYHCGYHSEKSFGAASYFITRPDGNILVDSPKFTEKLAKKFESLGGISYMFLSHKDDIADHKKWQERFSCQRIMHKYEIQDATMDIEIQLEGSGPWDILGEDMRLIFTPGHTEGSVCLFYKPVKVLFTGDHLASDDKGQLRLFRQYNWYSVEKQVDSMKPLIPLEYVWILPGHGRRIKYESVEVKNAALESLIAKENLQSQN